MPTPEQDRLDVISASLGRMLRKQAELEERLLRIEQKLDLPATVAVSQIPLSTVPPPLPSGPGPPPLSQDPSLLPEMEPAGTPQSPSTASYENPKLETSIGLTLINRVGAVTLVLGIGFLFKLAVDNHYIGPAGRVELGLLAGLLALGGADVLWRRSQQVFAQGVTATGIAIIYLALYAAFGLYHLVPQAPVFLGMVVTTLLSVALALRYEAIAIAALALAGGFLTPIMLSTGENRPWFLFSYILFLDAGAFALEHRKRWRLLEVIAAVGTVLLYGGWFASYGEHSHLPATIFALLFYGLFAVLGEFQPITVAAQILASLAITVTWTRNPGSYFPLALLLGGSGLAVADRRGWRGVLAAAFASFWLFSGLFSSEYSVAKPVMAIFTGLTVGFLLFLFWIPWWFLMRREHARTQDLTLLALNGASYFGISYYLLNPHYHAWMGLFAVAIAGIHLALGWELAKRQPQEERESLPVLLSIGVALTLLTLAAPIQFSAWRITMSWAIEGLALSWIATRLQSWRAAGAGAVIFILVWARLVMVDAWIYSDPHAYSLLFNERFLTFLVAAACLALSALWMENPRLLRLGYILAAHFVLLWGLTQEVIGWAARTTAVENLISVETISTSILYAVYAVAAISLGVATRTAVNRITGLALIGLVVLKLYLFDVWQLGRLYRTIAFVALGILLLSTSFLYSRFRELIETWWKDDQPAA